MNQQSYEQSVKELESIVNKLESGNVPLEEMVELYEQGMKLYRICSDRLNDYQKRLKCQKENEDA